MPKIDVLAERIKDQLRRTVILTITHDCNLRCRYCYEHNKSREYMDFNTAQQAVAEAFEADDGFESVEIDFSGGEPLLVFDLIRDLVDWFHTRSWMKKHLFFIGTNGTILSDEIKNWLIKNKLCVFAGVSLDGNKAAHDINRSNSYDRVMENLPFFIEHWPEQGVKMTISAESLPHVADSIIDFEERGIIFSSNIVFEDIWGPPEQKGRLLDIYAHQLDRLVEYYATRPELYPARIVDVKLEYLKHNKGYKQEDSNDCVRSCGSGHEMVTVDVSGRRSPCHRFDPWITGKPIPENANRQKAWKPDKCAECPLIQMCPSCAGFNYEINGDSGIRTTYHCEAFKLEVQASAKLQALRLLQTKPKNLKKMPKEDARGLKVRIDALLEIAESGV